MRILVLQLARFGDIYQTWPVLKALKRKYPEAELHVLVRHRFREAMAGFEGISLHLWPTADILEPIYLRDDEDAALTVLNSVVEPLKEAAFDRIINLSFSPVSSYLTDLLTHSRSEVSGYTRFSDGFLSIPDDASAYFFAQGEIGRFNRFHITQIFSLVAGVELEESDFHSSDLNPNRRPIIIIHLGASQVERIYPPEMWVKVISHILSDSEYEAVLIGSENEVPLADTVQNQVNHSRLKNKVGKTRLPELLSFIAEASLFIGCDSAPAQIASIVQTPVLQLASKTSNFWTTGPTCAGSRVIFEEELTKILPERVAAEALSMLRHQAPTAPCALRLSAIESYQLHDLKFDDFSWNLIQALYTSASYPENPTHEDILAFQRIFELAELGIQQLEVLLDPGKRSVIGKLLQNVDNMLVEVSRLNPRVDPLIQWFETERLRIPPGSIDQTLDRTKQLYNDLCTIASVYRIHESPESSGRKAVDLVKLCLPSIREFHMAGIQNEFQSLLSTLHELARHSTKVGDRQWSTLLSDLNQALERRDLIEVADQLEYVLIPALSC